MGEFWMEIKGWILDERKMCGFRMKIKGCLLDESKWVDFG
jgi:hypothetical protein